jgi:ketosteroid isomerase-like protein
MFTEDAYLLPNNGDFIQGRAAIELFWQNNVKLVKSLKLTTTYVQSLGSDAALEIGRSSNSINSQEVEGKYVILWRKAGASWKIAVDTFNRTKPPLK